MVSGSEALHLSLRWDRLRFDGQLSPATNALAARNSASKLPSRSSNLRQSNQQQQQLQARRAALEQIRDSLARNPQDTSLLPLIGSLQIEVGDTLAALATYQRYIDSLGSPNVVALTDYAFLLYATGERTRGFHLTEHAIRQAPSYQIALYNMAVMEFDRGRIAQAIAWMERCRAVDSSSAMGRLAQRAIEQLRQMQRDSS